MEQEQSLTIDKLDDTSLLADFFCGVQSMDEFIHQGLQMSLDNHFCRAYSVSLGDTIVAMFALSYDSIDLDTDDRDELATGISGAGTPAIEVDYKDTFYYKRRYPALDIAYLAVKKEYRERGIGESIIQVIIEETKNQDYAGCQFLSVEALKTKEYSAVGFYQKCGFSPNEQPNANKDTLRMFKVLYSES